MILDGHSVAAMGNYPTDGESKLSHRENQGNFTPIAGCILRLLVLKPLVDRSEYVFLLAAAVGFLA